ncbi:hypothetical protein H8D36_01130 [archaeon]|nr:hypothetical protein [archaeon]
MLIPFANAQVSGMDGNPLTFILGNIIEMANDLGSKNVTMPIYGHQLSYLHLFLTWLILFSLMWVASGLMPPFNKDASAAGARKTFAVAVSLLVTFGSPVAYYLFIFVSTWVTTIVVLGLIVLGWVMLKWLGRGQAHGAKYTAETRRLRNDGKAADNVIKDAKKSMNEMKKLTKLEEIDTKNLLDTLIKLKQYLSAAKMAKNDSEVRVDIENSMQMLSSMIQYESRIKNWETKEAGYITFFTNAETIAIKDFKRSSVDENAFATHLVTRGAATAANKNDEAKKQLDAAVRDQKIIVDLFSKWRRYDTFERAEIQKVDNEILDLRQALGGADIDRALRDCNTLIIIIQMEEKVEEKMEEIETKIGKLVMAEHSHLVAFLP